MDSDKLQRLRTLSLVASKNIESLFPDENLRTRTAVLLADTAMSDIRRRSAYGDRYALATGRQIGFRASNENPEDPIAGGILDLLKCAKKKKLQQKNYAYGRGLSSELASTLQLGDWQKGHAIEDDFNRLPESQLLEDNGIHFTDTFTEDEDKPTGYKFAATSAPDGEIAVRQAVAAGDIVNQKGTQLHIIRHSLFLATGTMRNKPLIADAAAMMKQYERAKKKGDVDSDGQKQLQANLNEIGSKLVSASTEDPEESGVDILPVSSQWFALYRTES